MKKPISQIEKITPAIAADWLEKSQTHNRNYSQAVINSYAATMKKGDWWLNGEPIAFDKAGNLLNGHHRLEAVKLSGCTIESFVVRGVEPRAISTFDCGRNRTFGQLITMQGETNGNNIAAAIRVYLVLKNEHTINNNGAYDMKNLHETNKTMVDFFLMNRQFFIEIAGKASSIVGKARVLNASFVGGSMAYLVRDCGYSMEKVSSFFEQLCSADTSENETINILRKRFLGERESKKEFWKNKIRCALAIKCWNVVAKNKKNTKLAWDFEKDPFPKYLKANEI